MTNLASIKMQLIEAYDNKVQERDATTKEDWKVRERNEFLDTLRKHQATTLLEIGCGPGQDAQFFKDNELQVTCVDMSPKMIDLCRQKGLDARVMDFSRLDFDDNSFDAVWALNCLLHVPKAELPDVLAGIHRVLKPGGQFYMGVYGRVNSEGIWENDSYEPKRFFSFFDDETLKATFSEFFTIASFKTLPHSDVLDFQSVVMVRE